MSLARPCLHSEPAPRDETCLVLQERAYVTGLRSATLVTEHLHTGKPASILPVEADEPHIAAGKAVVGGFARAVERTGLSSLFL